MFDANAIGFTAAFFAGAVSFLSPCVLPLVPAYVSYIAGQSGLKHPASPSGVQHERASAALLSGCFVLGFSTIFVALGAGATALGGWLLQYRYEANIVGGVIVMLFGLVMLGLTRPFKWLQRDVRFQPATVGGRPAAAYVLGLAFGFGWTPCIGPVLGAILTLGALQSSASDGIVLLAFYAAGLGVPFIAAAIFMRQLLGRLKSFRRAGRFLQLLAGVIMVIMGAAMVSGHLASFAIWILKTFPALGRIG